MTVHFGMELYNDQRNAQIFNLFVHLLLPYMFRALFKPIFRSKCANSAVVLVSWVWGQRASRDGTVLFLGQRPAQFHTGPGADPITRRLEPLPNLHTCL
jgi:hypothetical protein